MATPKGRTVDDAVWRFFHSLAGINAAQEWLEEVEEKNKMLFKIK